MKRNLFLNPDDRAWARRVVQQWRGLIADGRDLGPRKKYGYNFTRLWVTHGFSKHQEETFRSCQRYIAS